MTRTTVLPLTRDRPHVSVRHLKTVSRAYSYLSLRSSTVRNTVASSRCLGTFGSWFAFSRNKPPQAATLRTQGHGNLALVRSPAAQRQRRPKLYTSRCLHRQEPPRPAEPRRDQVSAGRPQPRTHPAAAASAPGGRPACPGAAAARSRR